MPFTKFTTNVYPPNNATNIGNDVLIRWNSPIVDTRGQSTIGDGATVDFMIGWNIWIYEGNRPNDPLRTITTIFSDARVPSGFPTAVVESTFRGGVPITYDWSFDPENIILQYNKTYTLEIQQHYVEKMLVANTQLGGWRYFYRGGPDIYESERYTFSTLNINLGDIVFPRVMINRGDLVVNPGVPYSVSVTTSRVASYGIFFVYPNGPGGAVQTIDVTPESERLVNPPDGTRRITIVAPTPSYPVPSGYAMSGSWMHTGRGQNGDEFSVEDGRFIYVNA